MLLNHIKGKDFQISGICWFTLFQPCRIWDLFSLPPAADVCLGHGRLHVTSLSCWALGQDLPPHASVLMFLAVSLGGLVSVFPFLTPHRRGYGKAFCPGFSSYPARMQAHPELHWPWLRPRHPSWPLQVLLTRGLASISCSCNHRLGSSCKLTMKICRNVSIPTLSFACLLEGSPLKFGTMYQAYLYVFVFVSR